jgi:hypothetical protein
MLNPRAMALDREKAMRLIAELQEAEDRLKRLRDGLAKLLEEDDQAG